MVPHAGIALLLLQLRLRIDGISTVGALNLQDGDSGWPRPGILFLADLSAFSFGVQDGHNDKCNVGLSPIIGTLSGSHEE